MTRSEHTSDAEKGASVFRSVSGWIPLLMSGAATALVIGYLVTGPHASNLIVENGISRPEESATARLWQLLIVLQLPVMGWFAVKWLPRHPKQAIAMLALQAFAVVAASIPVIWLEA